MEEQCLVMCGDWVCGHGSKWDFVVDKWQMARLVPVSEGITMKELQVGVLREFGKEEKLWKPVLSYWSPSSLELATGIQTPPVQLTSDGAIKYFVQHFRVKGAMNLFVRFEQKLTTCDGRSGISNGGYVTTDGSKAKAFDFVGVEFMSEVERVEAEIESESKCGKGDTFGASGGGEKSKSGSKYVEGDAFSGSSGGEDETVRGEEVNELDVRPRGYDKDFWNPLLSSDYKGSNAVNVIYNEDEIVDGLTRNSGPRRYTCTTNDAFDHVVELGGSSSGVKLPKDEDFHNGITEICSVSKKTKLIPNRCGRCRGVGHNRSRCNEPIKRGE
ncbi:hypothetical protein F2Q69_00027617 [Brassica cretica]|uniref:Uncharacterized protein n=1 Tax=Brassica cretica TaxID=69181 RepID=A0A8S9S363_BRACR|nr:hypothetical protein F2Q69_00027617 [Brassica cretica]